MIGGFEMEQLEILSIALDVLITVVVVPLLKKVIDLSRDMHDADKRNREFEMSMQWSEIVRAFQRHVEDGKPISLEEMEHLDKCYEAYHANGGNSTGTLLYERVKANARIVTKVEEDEQKIGGAA